MIEQIRLALKRCDTLVEDTLGLFVLIILLLATLHFPTFA